MATSINAQTPSIIAKDLLIAAIGERFQHSFASESKKAAEEIAAAYEVIYRKVKEMGA